MKVIFLSRVDLYNPRGGDTVQIEKTKEYVQKEDPSIQIDISTEIYPPKISEYDLVHVFNIDWVSETFPQIKFAKDHNQKVVLSAIHHDEDEVKKYEEIARYDIRRVYNFFIPSQSARDTWKNVYRSIFNIKKLHPTLIQLRMGIRNQQRAAIELSDVVLVQTEAEAVSIRKDFNLKKINYKKVVNGVDSTIFINSNPDSFNKLIQKTYGVNMEEKKIILNVGRIEPRKNQLELIEVFEELQNSGKLNEYLLVFIGVYSNKSYEYIHKFRSRVQQNKNILSLGGQSQEIVASAMKHSGIYVHPSWFETTGLVCLEALISGMPVVTTSTRLSEYVSEGIDYCRPENRASIKDAILKSVSANRNLDKIVENIKQNYTWEIAAQQTINVYKMILNS